MAKEQKEYILKDMTGTVVQYGDEVVVLCREYGYRKLVNAYMRIATYTGHGQYGYQFYIRSNNGYGNTVNIREPEVVKLHGSEEE